MSVEYCTVCAGVGRQSRLSLYQINLTEAFRMCPVPKCTYPFSDHEKVSKGIIKRSASDISSKRRKSLKRTISVHGQTPSQSPFTTPLQSPYSTPSQSPLSFDKLELPGSATITNNCASVPQHSENPPAILPLSFPVVSGVFSPTKFHNSVSAPSVINKQGNSNNYNVAKPVVEINPVQKPLSNQKCAMVQPGIKQPNSVPVESDAIKVIQPVAPSHIHSMSQTKAVASELLINKTPLPSSRELKVARLKAERFLQWQNVDNLCWLDVALCLLVKCTSVAILSAQLSKCMLKDVLLTYKEANDNLRRAIEFKHYQLKCNKGSEIYLETSVGSVVVRVGGGDVTSVRNSSKGDSLKNNSLHADDNSKTSNFIRGAGDWKRQVTTKAVLSELAYKSSPLRGAEVPHRASRDNVLTVTTQDLAQKCTELAEIGCEKMMGVRERVWDEISHTLGCLRGQNHSPLFVLPLLVGQQQLLVDQFMLQFEWQMICNVCKHHHCDSHEKTVATFPGVPSVFTMEKPYFIRHCPKCAAPGQHMNMIYKKLPQVLLVHFAEGLHADVSSYDFTVEGVRYAVSGVLQAVDTPSHFIAWIHNVPLDLWMVCDDLKAPVCNYDSLRPSFPPSEVHIMMWERQPVDIHRNTGVQLPTAGLKQTTMPTSCFKPLTSHPVSASNGKVRRQSKAVKTKKLTIVTPNSSHVSNKDGKDSCSSQNAFNPNIIDKNNASTIFTVIKNSTNTKDKTSTSQTTLSNDSNSKKAVPKSCLSPRKSAKKRQSLNPDLISKSHKIDFSPVLPCKIEPAGTSTVQTKKEHASKNSGSREKLVFKAPSGKVKTEKNADKNVKKKSALSDIERLKKQRVDASSLIDSKWSRVLGKRKSDYSDPDMLLRKLRKSNLPQFQGYIPKSEQRPDVKPKVEDMKMRGTQPKTVNFSSVVKIEESNALLRGIKIKREKAHRKSKKVKLEPNGAQEFLSLDNPNIVSIQSIGSQSMKMQEMKYQPMAMRDTKVQPMEMLDPSAMVPPNSSDVSDRQVDEFCESLNEIMNSMDTKIDDVDLDLDALFGPDN